MRKLSSRPTHPIGPRLRVILAPGFWMGPGKADLLQGIQETGSISAAGRRLGMSYKRAWLLIETLNANFKSPLVETAKGGAQGGGAKLTAAGEDVLVRFRRMEAVTAKSIMADMKVLLRQLNDVSIKK